MTRRTSVAACGRRRRAFGDGRSLLLVAAFLFTGTALHAQGPSPVEQRLREQLKSLTQRVSTAEAAAATLQTEKTAVEEELKKQKASFEKLVKESNDAKELAKVEGEKLKADIAAKEKELAEKKAELERANAFGVKASTLAQKTEAERAKLAQEGKVLKNIVSDQRLRNSKMLATAKEILDRYSKFGLGTALTAREPFVGITRARLESYMENYDSELSRYRIRLDGTSPKVAAPSNDRPADGKPAEKTSAAKP
jgi:chromosome segregation ATPase